GGTGDHAVGETGVHHHGGEVGDIRDAVARHVHGHAIVLAQFGVLGGKPLGVRAAARVEHLRVGEVDAQFVGATTDGVDVAGDRQVGHVAPHEAAGGVEDAVVVALGQDDVAPVGAGALEQLVLEHLRGHHVGAVDAEPVEQLFGVDVLLHEAQRGLDLAPGAGVDAAPGVGGGAGGVVGAEIGTDHRQGGAHPVDQTVHGRVRQQAPVPDHAGHGREPLGAVRGEY